MGYLSNLRELGWFKSFLILELLVCSDSCARLADLIRIFLTCRVFQFPVFFLGLQGLWNGIKYLSLPRRIKLMRDSQILVQYTRSS